MRFHERQQFRQPWLWLIFAAVSLPLAGLLGYGLYQQLLMGKPFGDQPMSDTSLMLVFLGTLALHGAVIALFWFARLDVEVTPRELLIRFRPFHFRPKRIALEQIVEARQRRYSPIAEYGGWGIRFGLHGTAYNVSGNDGVQLTLAGGKKILIGSQRSGELEAAIREAVRAAATS